MVFRIKPAEFPIEVYEISESYVDSSKSDYSCELEQDESKLCALSIMDYFEIKKNSIKVTLCVMTTGFILWIISIFL